MPDGHAKLSGKFLFIEPSETNAKWTYEALKSFGYDVSDLAVNDLLARKVLIRQYLVETDGLRFSRRPSPWAILGLRLGKYRKVQKVHHAVLVEIHCRWRP